MKFIICLTAAVSLLYGCGPQNLHECRMEAAKMPTERGSIIANSACLEKFPRDPVPEPKP